MIDVNELKFDEKGLIPVVVQDFETGEVLTLAYMNRESLEITLREGRTCFWSRSRQELWRKGETSGNVQHVVNVTADCDRDALVVQVRKDGPACHLGTESCFNELIYRSWRARSRSRSTRSISCCRSATRSVRRAAIRAISSKRAGKRSSRSSARSAPRSSSAR